MRIIRWCSILVAVVLLAAPASAASAWHARRVGPMAPECTLVGTDGHDDLRGTSGDDVICALGGGDSVSGRRGDDIIYLGGGEDGFDGGGGNDVVYGQGGADSGFGGAGDDLIYGQGAGDNIMVAGTGIDTVSGGKGDDSCLATWDDRGGDSVIGGPGHDIYGADAGDRVSSAEEGPLHCEGG
jgi:Ca2+-binding RTX toxin-like protein